MFKFRLLLLTIGLFVVSCISAAPILGEGDGFLNYGPYWADNDPVRIKIDPSLNGSVVSSDFSFNVYYDNLSFVPEEATSLPTQYANGKRSSNSGHVHLYATWLGDNSLDSTDDNFWNYTNVFVGASDLEVEPGVLEYSISLPEDGDWMIYAESQYDDHTSRIRSHPQQLGSWDAAIVTVDSSIPEPGSLLLLSIGGILVCSRRRKRISI